MARDQRVESLLKRGNYRNQYHDKVSFADIDFVASEENPARINRKIDDLTVNQYGCAMLEGAVFPGIVLLKQDRAKYLVATGMHRCKAAMEVKRDWFDGYVITEADQFRCDLLIRLLNGIEGRGDTIKDQLRHVISLHEKYNRHSLNELATAFNLSKSAVMSAWQAHKGIQRASRLGFDFEGAQKQPQTSVIHLDQIVSDLVYVKAAEFIVHYDIPGREVEEMVRELKAVRGKGESAEFQLIKKYHDEAEEKQRRAKSRVGKTSPTACTRFIGKCRGINKQMRKGIEHLHLSALGNINDALTVIEDSIDNLSKVKAELERIQRISGGTGSGASDGGSSASMMSNDQSNWRNQCVALLAKQPTDWVRLSELFAAVEPMIPLHFAMRHATRNGRSTDIGVNTARWRLFLHHINTLVDRRPSEGMSPTGRAMRTDFVRLKPYETPCADCSGPRFLIALPQPGFRREYACPHCTKPVVAEPVIEPVVAEPTTTARQKVIENRPNAHQRRGVRPTRTIASPTPRPTSRPRPAPPVPRPTPKPDPIPLQSETLIPFPKPVVDSKKLIAVQIGGQRFTFTNWRVLAQYVKGFLGLSSINQIEQELQKTNDLSAVLGKRGKTLRDFVLRLSFMSLNKS